MGEPYIKPQINVKLPKRKKSLEEKVRLAAEQGLSYGELISAETKILYARVSKGDTDEEEVL